MKTLTRTALILSSAALLTAANAQAGKPTTLSEKRGYQNCLAKADDEHRGFYSASEFYINETDASRTFYINAGAWIGSKRQPLRVECETNLSGKRVLALSSAVGRYSPATEVNTYEVAAQ